MFFGWWSLGCNLSLSPFALALAFDAPVLEDVNSAAGAKGVVDELGSVKLKYGVVDVLEGDSEESHGFASRRLGVGHIQAVSKPQNGDRFPK